MPIHCISIECAIETNDRLPVDLTDPDIEKNNALDKNEDKVRTVDNRIRNEHLGEKESDQEVKLRKTPS